MTRRLRSPRPLTRVKSAFRGKTVHCLVFQALSAARLQLPSFCLLLTGADGRFQRQTHMKVPDTRSAVIAAAVLAGLSVSTAFGQGAPAPSASASNEAVRLDPFSVSADSDVGFVAASALAGGRISTALKDTPVAFSVITKEFLDAFNITDIASASNWTTNSDYALGDGSVYIYGGNESSVQRVRGVQVNTPTRNFFPYNAVTDSFNIDRVDYARGANAVLFGAGGAGGTQNTGTKQALMNQDLTEVRAQVGSWDKYRFTADVNRVITDKWAVRTNLMFSSKNDWRDRLWEDKKGFHFATTYKVTPKLTARGEFEYLDTRRAVSVFQYRDFVSAWDGKTYDFAAPLTGAGAPSAASLAQMGIARFPQRFVTHPDYAGKALNFQNRFRTTGLAYNASAPNYFKGQPVKTVGWSLRAEAMIDSLTGIPDDQRYANVMMGSPFFTVPNRTDTPLYDDPGHNFPINASRSRDASLYLTYAPFQGFFVEIAGDSNSVRGFGDTTSRRGMQEYYMDIVRTLPDGTTNPWFLHPYQERGHYKQGRLTERDSLRIQSVYVKDTRFGKLQAGFMGGLNIDTVSNRSSELMLKADWITPDARSWINNGELNEYFLWNRTYFDDKTRPPQYAFIEEARPVTVVDPVTSVTRVLTPTWMWDARREDNVYDSERNSKYLQFAGNFDMFKNRLVLIGAFRRDFIDFSQNRVKAPGDHPAGWDGVSLVLRQAAPKDYDTLMYTPKNAAGVATGSPIPADTRPRVNIAGAAMQQPQYVNDRFRDDFDSPDVKRIVNTGTLGGVININKWLGVYANRSTTFSFGTANQSVWNKFLPPTTALGKDAGIRVTLPNNKLSFSAGWYRAYQKGALVTVGDGFLGNYNAIGDLAPVGDLNGRNIRNFARFRTNNIASTQTNDTTGYEFELTANLRPNWRLIANFGTNDAAAIDANVDLVEYFAYADPIVRQILADGGIQIDASTQQASIRPEFNDPTKINLANAEAAVNGWNGLVNTTIPSITSRGKQRVKVLQSVPWSANIATDYRFRTGPLNGLRLGLGANIRADQYVGNRGGDTIRDPKDPTKAIDDPSVDATSWVKAKGYHTATASLSYTVRLKEARRFTPKSIQFDLSIDNLLDRRAPLFGSTQGSHNTSDTVFVPRDGTLSDPSRVSVPGNFSYLTPRNFTLTAKMDF